MFVFRWDQRLYHDLYFDYIFTGNERQSDSVNAKPRVNWFPWSCSDIFCIHKHIIYKTRCQSVTLNHSHFVSSCNEKEWYVTRQNGCMGRETNPYKLDQPIIVSSRKVPPDKGTKEALRDKTKSCCTGLTCQHNNTKSWYCYKSLRLTI